jgi:PAS domain S-box-containing protein
MVEDESQSKDNVRLHRSVEILLRKFVADPQTPRPEEVQRLVQESETRRLELESQNEQLRRAQRQLEQYRDRYIHLYDFAPLGYVSLDEDGYVQEINLAGVHLLGVEREGVTGYSFVDYVVPDDRTAFLEHVRQCVHQRQEMTSEVTLQAKDGRSIAVQLHSIPEEAENDTVFCKTAFTDISERRKFEEQLRAFNESLERRVAERTAVAEHRAMQLRALASELSQAEQRERRRLAQALHDQLQQLLVLTKIRLGALNRQLREEEPRSLVGQIQELLDQSIAESRSLTAELSPAVLYDVGLAAGLDWLARQMQEKHSLRVELRADRQAEPSDEGTRVFLFQAVRELLLNVVQHAGTDQARVEMARVGGQVKIEVRDPGRGFEPASMEADTGSTTGFGLFSIRERLELLGGRLEIHSTPGQGTQTMILAPLHQLRPVTELAAPYEGVEPMVASRGERVVSGRIRVLLADDHPLLRKGLADLLRERPEMEVVGEARDGEEAVELALQTKPDVVLMDISMPKLSGVEATRYITTEMPRVRVIGLSMHQEEQLPAAMREAGAAGYLLKSASADVLIGAILGRQPQHSLG